jgi:DNA-binding transcriptional ArsR family regulator
MVAEAFSSGADGVFIGACRRGECHYSTGNLYAEVRVELIKSALETAGISPERLVMRMMSSAEGNKFVEFISEFQRVVGDLGPLGEKEGLNRDAIQRKLKAIRDALGGPKLRWVVGKVLEFKDKGNLYGEKFTDHEIRRLFEEITMDEVGLREILEILNTQPHSVSQLSQITGSRKEKVLMHLADLRRMGIAEIARVENRTPLWQIKPGARSYE